MDVFPKSFCGMLEPFTVPVDKGVDGLRIAKLAH